MSVNLQIGHPMNPFFGKQTRPKFSLMEALAELAHTVTDPRVVIHDAATTIQDQYRRKWRPLKDHFQLRGWQGDGSELLPALKRDGWDRFERDGKWFWVLSRAVPWWGQPHFLLDRCDSCKESNNYRCDCTALNDLTPITKLYVLALEGGRYYCGLARRPMARLQQHATGIGATWTREHKPLRIESCRIVPTAHALHEEDAETLNLMRRYGVDQVQGGKFVGVDGQRHARIALGLEEEGARPRGPILLTFKDLRLAQGGDQ